MMIGLIVKIQPWKYGFQLNNRSEIMNFYRIKCEAIDVKTDSGICPGIAKTEKGEQFILGARTPNLGEYARIHYLYCIQCLLP